MKLYNEEKAIIAEIIRIENVFMSSIKLFVFLAIVIPCITFAYHLYFNGLNEAVVSLGKGIIVSIPGCGLGIVFTNILKEDTGRLYNILYNKISINQAMQSIDFTQEEIRVITKAFC